MPAIFGAPIWLGFMWRRLTKTSVAIQIFVSFLIIVIIPNIFQSWETPRTYEGFLKQTNEKQIVVTTKALQEDVDAGEAVQVGQMIEKDRVLPSYPIFYEDVARENPDDPNSRLMGFGRFHAEVWLLSLVGIDFSNFNKAQLNTVRFMFDALFPILFLIVVSYLTKPVKKDLLDYFYAKVHTPVQPEPEADLALVQKNAANMEKFESRKLFPKTQWEFHKPMKMDYIGFFGTWVLVGVVILVMWIFMNIGG
jgi:SSS family solute:Na+ symporter